MITLAELEAQGCAVVRIKTEINFAGCFVAEVHGWAVSLPDEATLDRVFLCEDGEIGDERAEFEMNDPAWGKLPNALEHVLSKALWRAARKLEVAACLKRAQETAIQPRAMPRILQSMQVERNAQMGVN